MKAFRIACFSIVMLLYLWFPSQMILSTQEVLRRGVQYRFKPEPVDPYDAFRGRYINMNYAIQAFPGVPEAVSAGRTRTVYAEIATDSEGFAHFDKLYFDPPEGVDYIKTTIQSQDGSKIYINIPENMQRFYLNEELAPEAEQIYRALTARAGNESQPVPVFLNVRVLEGAVVIEELYFEGKPIKEYLRQLKTETN